MPKTYFIFAIVLAFSCASSSLVLAKQKRHEFRQLIVSCSASREYVAKSQETLEFLYSDGTSVIVSGGSNVRLSCGEDGMPHLQLNSGLARISGGAENANTPMLIRTSDADLRLSSGAAIIAVEGGVTRTHLLNGVGLSITSGGAEEVLYRSGFEVVASDTGLTRPRRMGADEATADLLALSRGLAEGTKPVITTARGVQKPVKPTAPARSNKQDGPIDVLNYGIDGKSKGPLDIVDLREASLKPSGPETPFKPPEVVDPVTPPPTALPNVPFDPNLGGLPPASSYQPSKGANPALVIESSTTTMDSGFVIRPQEATLDRPSEDGGISDGSAVDEMQAQQNAIIKRFGPTTNKVFNVSGLSRHFTGDTDLSSFYPALGGISYFTGATHFGLKSTQFQDYAEETGLFFFNQFISASNGSGTNSKNEVLQDGISRVFSFNPNTSPTGSGTSFGDDVGAVGYVANFGNALIPTRALDLYYDQMLETFPQRRPDNFVIFDLEAYKSIYYPCAEAFTMGCTPADRAAFQKTLNMLAPELEVWEGVGGEFDATLYSALVEDPTDNRRLIFATGEVNGLVNDPDGILGSTSNGFSVDRFYISAGMRGDLLNGLVDASGQSLLAANMDLGTGRAFMRAETWTDLDPTNFTSTQELVDSGVIIANPSGPVVDVHGASLSVDNPTVLHVDFGLKTLAGGQISTISATIGDLTYRYGTDLDGQTGMVDGILSAKTVGSSRGFNSASTLISGSVMSTAAGGGNPLLGADPGRMGFLVTENAGLVFDDVVSSTPVTLPGGLEAPLGAEPKDFSRFALLRLGVGVSSSVPLRNGFNDLVGYASGFVETESSTTSDPNTKVTLSTISQPFIGGNASPPGPNLRFGKIDLETNRFSADLAMNGANFLFGGADFNKSAYATDTEFGALSTSANSDLALISGDMVSAGFNSGNTSPLLSNKNEHVKWGFFFGDAVGVSSPSPRQHVHMGTFAAGQRIKLSERVKVASGEYTYSGHAVGNVSENGKLRTVAGSYSDTFDFGKRTGAITMNFDGRSIGGNSTNPGDAFAYAGVLKDANASQSIGTVHGEFVSQGGKLTTANIPGGLIGSFDISDGNYRATGSIGAISN